MSSSIPASATLSTGKYTIELSKGSSQVYKIDELGKKIWVCGTSDPQVAMDIIEGLILVEHKRFYHPEATPTVSMEKPKCSPPFLKKE